MDYDWNWEEMDPVIVNTVSENPEEVSMSVAIISLVICVAGIIGNLVAIFVIITLKEYKKSITHWYILHLAVADSIFLLTLPFQVSNELNGSWIYSEWLCSAKETILFSTYYASILFLMVMSIDRYIAVCKSFSVLSQWLRKRESSYIIAVVVWGVAILLTIPIMLYSTISGDSPENCNCTYKFPQSMRKKCEQEARNIEDCIAIYALSQQNGVCTSPFNVSHNNFNLSERSGDESYYSSSGEEYVNDLTASNDTFALFADRLSRLNITKESGDMSGDEKNMSGSGSGVSGSGNDSMTTINHTIQTRLNPECHYQDQAEGFKAFLYFNFVVMFAIPLVVMVWCYGMIIRRLSATRVRLATPKSSLTPSVTGGISKQTERKRKSSSSEVHRRRVNIMCASLVSCFLICWLPYHSVHLAKLAGIRDTETEACSILLKFGSVLAFLNSALNPYLYNFLGTNFSHRLQTATGSFRRSSSSGSFASFGRGTHNRNLGKRRSSTKTMATKLSRNPETNHSSSAFAPNVNATQPPANSSSDIGSGQNPLNPKEGDLAV